MIPINDINRTTGVLSTIECTHFNFKLVVITLIVCESK